jgi:hypothetical protein
LQQACSLLEPKLATAEAEHSLHFPLSVALAGRQAKLTGLPMFVLPYLEAAGSPAGQFLLAGGFPLSPSAVRPLPPPIMNQLMQKNLMFYHWEITAECEPGMLQLSQFSLLETRHKQLNDTDAAMKWLKLICPKLGNCVTEVLQTAPDEMTFSRKAPGVLTMAEFFALANWLEADNFPDGDLKLAPLKPHPAIHPPAPGK